MCVPVEFSLLRSLAFCHVPIADSSVDKEEVCHPSSRNLKTFFFFAFVSVWSPTTVLERGQSCLTAPILPTSIEVKKKFAFQKGLEIKKRDYITLRFRVVSHHGT